RAVLIDGKGVLRHVRIVEAEAGNSRGCRPSLQALAILRKAVGEHLRPWRVAKRRVDVYPAALGAIPKAGRMHLEAQQPALERTVPERVRAVGTNADLQSQLRRAGQHGDVPPREPFPKHSSELFVDSAR